MSYHGDIRLGKTIDVKFTTINGSGVATALAGSPAIAAYPDNSTTEITAGITLSTDFDSRTGLNNVRVVATSGNGYATATNYTLVITAGTVDGTSVVGYVVASFSIEARSALMPATADRTLVVDAAGLADANAVKLGPTGSGTAQTARDIGASVLLSSGTGTGQVKLSSGYVAPNWGDVGNPTTTVGLSGTTVKTATDVETDTQDIQARLPAALTANGNMKASLVEILTTALTETAGLLAGGFKKFFNVSSPTGTLNSIPDAVAGASGGLLIAGSNAATTVNITGNITGNLSGSVGSVTGAVGSVVADVGITQTGADKVWGSATRTLTSFGTLVADIWAGVTQAFFAAFFTQDSGKTFGDAVAGSVVKEIADNSGGSAPTPTQIWDEPVDGTVTARESLRLANAANGGITAGMDTATGTIRDLADTKDRVTATLDGNGNRTAVSRDLS